jgi:hypothetical protein
MITLTHSTLLRSLTVPAVAARPFPSVSDMISAWRAQRRRAREDRELWALAQLDARVMTELACARSRQD